MEISGEYTAMGGEIHLIIGNFNSDKLTQKELVNKLCKGDCEAYYYLDDVCISPVINGSYDCNCDNSNGCKCYLPVEKKPKYEIGKPVILNNILFEIGKSVLLPKSFEELDSLAQYLKQYSKLLIEISGHTDNTGTDKDNQLLSENRAKAVADYLIMKGIDKTRVSFKGYGSINPIVSNNTDEGKAKNRRVEIIIKL
jgi:hypothetical protein